MQIAKNVLAQYSEREGWTPATQLELLLDYIQETTDQDEFEAFLQGRTADGEEMTGDGD